MKHYLCTMIEMQSIIENAKNIVITTHKGPDGDAIGSSLALYHLLKQLDKNVSVIVPDAFPDFLNWIEGADQIICFDKNQEQAEKLIDVAEVIFSLDYNALNRIGDMGSVLEKATGIKVMIDHHQDTQGFAQHYFVDTDCCSTAQLVYEFIHKINKEQLLNKAIATCIYCGIMTDTGSFRYPSTTAETHRIIAHLIECGAENSLIHQEVYDNNTTDRLKLLGYALSNKMQVYEKHQLAYIALSAKEMNDFNFKKGDTEGLVNYPLSIKGIKLSVLLTEKEDGIRISFRSKNEVYVNKIAQEHFGGGGHVYAAGGISKLSLEETIKKLEEILLK
mgnify:FL=1